TRCTPGPYARGWTGAGGVVRRCQGAQGPRARARSGPRALGRSHLRVLPQRIGRDRGVVANLYVTRTAEGGRDNRLRPLPSSVGYQPFGPAPRISAETASPNFLMFSRNIPASFFACSS